MFSKHSSSRLVECVVVYILTLSSLSLVSVNGEEPTDEPIPEGSPNRLPTTNLPSPSSRISNNSIGITSLEMKSRRSTPVHHTSSSELQTAGLVSSQTPMQTTGLVSSQTPVVETSYLHISISSGVNSSSRTEAAVYSTFSALSQTWADQTRHLRTIVSSASSQTSSLFPVHRSPTSSLSLSNVVVSSSLHPSSSAARSHTSSLVRISASTPGSTNVITPTVSGSTIVQSGLVGSASLQFSTSVSGVFASRTVLVSQLSSRTTRSTAMMPQSVHSSPLIQPSSTVQPLPPTSPPPPDPPIIQEVTALSANSVYLKWNVSSGQVITNFTVEFGVNLTTWVKADCNHSLVEEACVVTQRNAVVVGLQPFTNYTFRVVARSQFGSSNGSIATEWVTTKEGVPSQPNQAAVKALNSTAMFLNWTEPTEINGLLVKYEVNYSEKGSLEAVVIDAGLRKSQLLSPLKPYTVYVISIRAFTREGGGRPVTVKEQTNESPPSGPPQNVKAITISSSSIILYWSPPIESQQNGKITQYNITITSVLEQTRTVRTNDNSTKIPISDLEAYTNYSFVVQAINVAGVGPYSSLVSNVTFEAEPSPPRNVTAQSVNSTAVQVSWVKAMHPNGIIHYRLYERLSKDAEASNHLVYDGTNTEFVVSQLEEFITYTFTVESLNLKYKWTSTPAIATETTHPAEPTGPPQNARAVTLSSTSIRVTWEPPLQSEQNGIIIKYTVWYTTQSSGETKSLVTPDNRTSAEVKNLTGFTTYAFVVMAWNSVGSGSKSERVHNTTFEGIPSPPRNMVAKTINSTAVKVTWNSSQYPNGEIEYRLYYWQSSEGPSAKKQAYDGPALESIVTGLYEYVAYTFMLLAYNAKYSWSSSAVNATVTTHPAEPSSPPRNVVALTNSSTRVVVKWIPPKEQDRNGIITNYIVNYNLTSGGPEVSLNSTGNNTYKLVTNLGKYTVYNFTVQAVNKVGVGPASSPVSNRTFEDLPSDAPRNVTVVSTSSTSVTLSWEPPLEPNGKIVGYDVAYYESDDSNNTNIRDNIKDKVHTLTGLKPWSTYYIAVACESSKGIGPYSESIIQRTDAGVPSQPLHVQAWNTSESSIYVQWTEPANMNGVLQRYKVFYTEASSSSQSDKDAGVSTNTSLMQLEPFKLYTITVQAFTSKGGGDMSSGVHVMTDETVPSAVRDVSFQNPTDKSVEVTWKPPQQPNGRIGYYLGYWKTMIDDSSIETFELAGDLNSKVVTGLKPYVEYTFSVTPYNLKKALKGPSFNRSVKTQAAVPSDAPRNVTVVSTSSTSVTLSWEPPLEPNGEIVGYDVAYYASDDSNNTNIRDNIKDKVHTLTGLKPWSTYYIAVACESSKGIGPYSESIIQRTDAGDPPPIGTLAPPEKQKVTSTTFEVQLTKASNENGEVSYYQVIVRELAKDNRGSPVPPNEPRHYKAADLYTYDEARRLKPKLVPYIAFQFSASDFDEFKSFTVGDEKGSHDSMVTRSFVRKRRANRASVFYNGPLEEQTFYTVFQRAYVNKDVYSSSHWIDPVETGAASSPLVPGTHSTDVGLIVGLVVAILVVLVLVLIGTFYIRKKRLDFGTPLDDREEYSNGQPMKMKTARNKRRSLQKRLMGSTDSLEGLDELAASRARRQPVPIDDFERHVDRMHMDGDHGFSEEYSLVQPDDEFSYQQFLNPANKYKNRYANIVAYDHTRVLLNQIEGVAGSDYINANFIDGYNRPRGYVAAQGPLMETFDDFWRMMWEQNSLVIVMLTKLEERGRRKCDQYWPERGTRTYGHVQVTLTATLNMSYYTVRKMTVTHKLFPDEERSIKQFHFTAWPDHGVPSHPTPLLSLVRHVSTSNRDAYGPMVVHCSAGVGRTGTFITLDVMLQKISEEDCIDVFGFVRQMRYQRNYMVQTEAQYVFIHDALLEAITCGVTEVEAKDLGARLRELRQVDSETGYTYLENEFCRLAKEENHPIAFKSASLNCNALKNRYANILPFESTRVHLKMRPGEMGSDYINANYIDGYCQPKAYIATQAPVPDTFEDFWRLIWEHESAAVVMLTMEEEKGKVKCHHYWPSEGSRLYGVILVELAEEDSYSDYVTRKFKLTHTEEKDTRTVRQFQYTDWPDTGLPDSGVGIIDLIGQVQKWQQQSGNTAIVIHCSGGVGRTGVFCAISIMIERLKAEGVVDVFQTVQAMRLQRPAMVQTAEQYEFCYTTLQEYLDSFDLYANFQ